MPTPIERIKAALKALRFPQSTNGSAPLLIFNSLTDMSAAIQASQSGSGTAPTAEPTRSSLVASGVRWVSNTLPEAPVEVMKPGTEDDEPIKDHALAKLMRRPNPHTDEPTLWKAFAYSWLINGNAYWIKFRNDFGQVVQIWNEPFFSIRPRWVNDKRGPYILADQSQSLRGIGRNDSPNQFINYYEVDRDGLQVRIEPEDVVHFKDGEDPENRRLGLSFIGLILREIYGDSAAAEYAGGMLAANGVPPFVLSIDDKLGQLTQDDINGIKARLMSQINARGAREPLVTQFARVEKMGMTSEEIDLRTSRYLSEERFSAVTGIPLEVLNLGAGNEHSTYNNVTEAEKVATRRYLVPLWWAIDMALTRQLLPDFDQDESHYVEHDTSEVAALQPDENEESKRVIEEFKAGIITRAEARMARNREADDKVDNVYMINGELVPADYVTPEPVEAPDPAEMMEGNGFPTAVPSGNGQAGGLLARAKSIHPLSSPRQQALIREHWERHAPARVRGLITAKGR